jgi:hypothetical protein
VSGENWTDCATLGMRTKRLVWRRVIDIDYDYEKVGHNHIE